MAAALRVAHMEERVSRAGVDRPVREVVLVGVVCGWRGGPGGPRVRDGGHAHIRGLSQDLCSSHVRCLKSSAATVWVVAQATNRGVLCASRDARAASPAATVLSVSW